MKECITLIYEFDVGGRHYVLEDHPYMGPLPMTENYQPADRYPLGWFAALRWFLGLSFAERRRFSEAPE